jgi:GGDEF domain-containing protein
MGSEVRTGDCLARIGGDELALVATSAGAAVALREAAGRVIPAPGAAPLSLTVGWAVHPDDGADVLTLLETSDVRLNAGKRERRRTRR